ncbi:hypothetical protein CRENBAI_023897 [Crenichthys baileyi]|uniref:Caspase-1 n=1 Tax=Crenichthys baileyi TaxID=28760 RepID=A0AAV9SM26_9TELE
MLQEVSQGGLRTNSPRARRFSDKDLQSVRPGFVDKVSTEVIKQLLDGLLVDGVLNDGEKDSVLEENPTRADKARALIDKVKKKGHEASRKMIARLQELDQTLYCELGLSSDKPAQPAPAEPVNQRGLAPPVPTVKEFWMSKTDDPKAVDEAVMEFIKHPKLKHTDSVFVVIMSHGKLGKILGVNWTEDNPDEFPINNIFKHLGSKSCPELINKPKVIIIQACRGEQRGSVLVSDSPNTADDVPQPEDLEADKLQFVHPEKDFISLLSCTPDTVSYRQPDRGSLLIQYVVKVFSPESYVEHIYELFTKVMQLVECFRSCEKLQMPTIDRCTLIKSFYLFQGLQDNNH